MKKTNKTNKTIKIEKPWYHVIIETKYITHQVTTKRTKNKTNALKRCFDTIIDWLAEEAIPNSHIIKTSTGYRVETANRRNVCECYVLDSWD